MAKVLIHYKVYGQRWVEIPDEAIEEQGHVETASNFLDRMPHQQIKEGLLIEEPWLVAVLKDNSNGDLEVIYDAEVEA